MTNKAQIDNIRIGHLLIPGIQEVCVPLKKTWLNVQITGPMATVSVRQIFNNPIDHPVELDYIFPLPENAAVFDFEIRIGSRVIRADLQERNKAQDSYQQARDEGHQTALLAEKRPNLFSMRIANVLPGQVIESVIRYEDQLEYNDGEYFFVFPMGLTPRYNSPMHPEEDAAINPPISQNNLDIGTVEIQLSADCGAAVDDPYSPSHKIRFERLDDRRFQLAFAEPVIPDHDFVLHCPLSAHAPVLTAWSTPTTGSETFLALLIPPRQDDIAPEVQPRDFVFVLDRSGSMSGQSIAQARNALRACLRTLNPVDTFRILLFDDMLEWYQELASPASQEEIDRADTFLTQVEGRGGTEIVAALDAALNLPWQPTRQQLVIFLTDGAVSAEDRALNQVRRRLRSTRLFTFGIGPSVNRALLRKMALLGRGTAEFLQLDEDIESAIIRFQDRISFPVLRDVELEWENTMSWDVYPTRIQDLYHGQPIQICGRFKRENGGQPTLIVRAKDGKTIVQLDVLFPPVNQPEPAVARTWARMRMEELMESEQSGEIAPDRSRDEIISLSLQHRLLSPYTSFVALDHNEAVTGGKEPVTIQIAQPLPKGLDLAGFGGMQPPMPQHGFNLMSAAPAAAPRVDSSRSFHKINAATTGMVAESDTSALATPSNPLNKLIRSQKINGSWNDDPEQTAVALMAFLRSGNTTHQGHYRMTVQKAFTWLQKAQSGGLAAFIRAAALSELARITGLKNHHEAAAEARTQLPEPSNALEEAVLLHLQGQPVSMEHGKVNTLDMLRLAGLEGSKVAIPGIWPIAEEIPLVDFWRLLVD